MQDGMSEAAASEVKLYWSLYNGPHMLHIGNSPKKPYGFMVKVWFQSY